MHNQNKTLRVIQFNSFLKKTAKSLRFLSGILERTDRNTYKNLELIKELDLELQRE